MAFWVPPALKLGFPKLISNYDHLVTKILFNTALFLSQTIFSLDIIALYRKPKICLEHYGNFNLRIPTKKNTQPTFNGLEEDASSTP